jgi:signal transduction histidine kinase
LVTGLLASVFIVQVIVYLLIYARIEDEIDDLFDAELERSAASVNPAAPRPIIPTPLRNVENPQEGMVITVWSASEGPPSYQSHPQQGIPRSLPHGFSKRMIDHREWRLFATPNQGQMVIAAQPADVRDSAAKKIVARIILPSLAALPLAALMILMAVFYGLRPLARITGELRSRSHRDLAPIDVARLPPDIAPLAHALNGLMQRLSSIIGAQRTFIADAAHELLTPLTALRLQAQMLARAKSTSRREEAMAELQGGVSRTLQLARQLLTLARHDADTAAPSTDEIDLSVIVERVMTIHIPLVDEKALHLEHEIREGMWVLGDEEALAVLISNLLDNAIKYAGRGGRVRLTGRRESSSAILRIEDTGPGIPLDERERVFDRFYRRRDTTESGNGLGLAIAKDIAVRHGASIALGSSLGLGGLCAEVRFSASTAAGGAAAGRAHRAQADAHPGRGGSAPQAIPSSRSPPVSF